MEYTKKLFVFLQRATKQLSRYLAAQRPNALENSILAKLPVEIIQQIADSLPVLSAASFSLSCRCIYLLIGTQHLEIIATSPDDTLLFLNILERDLPNVIVCNPCRKFHRMKDAKKYAKNERWFRPIVRRPCLSSDDKLCVSWYIHWNFSSVVFKMAMKNHSHFGNDARTRKLFHFLAGEYGPYFCGGNLFRRGKAECQVNNGSLFLCFNETFQGKCADIKDHTISFWLCPHLDYRSRGESTYLVIETRSYPHEEKWSLPLPCKAGPRTVKSSWGYSLDFQQCLYCRTQYKTSVRHQSDCKIEVIITTWKDLGWGPESEEWDAHLLPERFRRL